MTELPDYADLPPAPRGGRSGWGLFGAGDNLGLVNLMTPERVAAAARLLPPGPGLLPGHAARQRLPGAGGVPRRAAAPHPASAWHGRFRRRLRQLLPAGLQP